jgi:hypothetical protein
VDFFQIISQHQFSSQHEILMYTGPVISIDVPFEEVITSGVNFTNVLRAAFTLVDPERVKNTVKLFVSFLRFRDLNAH